MSARDDYPALASWVAWHTPTSPAEHRRIGDADCALDEIDRLRTAAAAGGIAPADPPEVTP